MKTSLAKIAEAAGCSTSTASRILGGKAQNNRISAETVARVMEVARKMNYTHKNFAHPLRKEKTFTIGLILPSISNPFFAEMASNIVSEAYNKGYTTFVIDAMEDAKVFDDSIKRMVSKNVDGIIAVPCSNNSILLENINFSGTPVILADRFINGSALTCVTTNNYTGGLNATLELIRHGHKKITCIQGSLSSTPNTERVKGYKEAMTRKDLAEYIEIKGNEFSIQNGYLEAKMLLDRPLETRPTAIFALSNNITLGVMKAAKENQLRIPQDLSIISFDNFSYMDYTNPAITRISQPIEDMATMCTKLLFDRIDRHDEGKPEEKSSANIRLRPALISGESVQEITK